ncbi:hypothetical protein A1O7_01666 [Cladophialophora yegresii CBS 114405]|uniref:Uncharacterized protein n=1 Tax=Cladophialophora yegresii CBS 114405 TaxID=1182544 RepID=W9WK17_9EURO|nr:uncharacterized protein A1O7_01666 [Cladophialophora yegresii CBS 114405]EXJ65325.1 hypothetical protein A1O7_01666 [Cladophialophora yegresii CBS 114405]
MPDPGLNADQTAYMMIVLKNTEMNPDWKLITVEAGISKPSNAQRKFRQIVEAAGFKLVNNQIVDPGEDEHEDHAGNATRAPSPSATSQGRKRKSPTKDKKDASEEAEPGIKKREKKASQPVGDVKRRGKDEIKDEAAD